MQGVGISMGQSSLGGDMYKRMNRMFCLLLIIWLSGAARPGRGNSTTGQQEEDNYIKIHVACINCPYIQVTRDNIEKRGWLLVTSEKSFLGRELMHLIQRGKIEGFWNATIYFAGFDPKKVRVKIDMGSSVYYIDIEGYMLEVKHNIYAKEGKAEFPYALSRDTFLAIAQLLGRYQGTADLQYLGEKNFQISLPNGKKLEILQPPKKYSTGVRMTGCNKDTNDEESSLPRWPDY